MADLNLWARKDARISADVSRCQFFANCNARGTLEAGHCAMSYVGREYGNGVAFRLAVVGMDHGDRDRNDFEERRSLIESHYQKGGRAFNPHYAGVVKTAAAVFGSEGSYCGNNCTYNCQKSYQLSPACVLDRIAQPNVVKCVPDNATNRSSRATRTMWTNCAHHLIDELMILRPQLCVFHGVKARLFVPAAVGREHGMPTPVPNVGDPNRPALYEWPFLGSYLLFLSHPSHGWLARQWESVVVPALAFLRRQGHIPIGITPAALTSPLLD